MIKAVFRRLAGPVAPAGLAGAFWRGMRVAAVDGFLLDVPDMPANRAAFGGPVAARGQRTAPPSQPSAPPAPARPPCRDLSQERIQRQSVLGGLLSEYERAA